MKMFRSLSIMFLLVFVCFMLLVDSKDVLMSVSLSLDVFKKNVFPSLFPFFIISQLLLKYGFSEYLGYIFSGFMYKLFKINSRCAFVFFMSIISGNPANAKYTKELYVNGDINKDEALKIMCFSSFVNPLFILGFVGSILNRKIALLILICHYSSNIIVGFFLRNYHPSKFIKSSFKMDVKNSFGVVLTDAIISSINTLLFILGVITTCFVFTTIINNFLSFNNTFMGFFDGLIEITQGIKYLSMSDISLKIKSTMIVFLLSFGGLSIHLQIMGILSDVKYFPYLVMRLIASIISSTLFIILYS